MSVMANCLQTYTAAKFFLVLYVSSCFWHVVRQKLVWDTDHVQEPWIRCQRFAHDTSNFILLISIFCCYAETSLWLFVNLYLSGCWKSGLKYRFDCPKSWVCLWAWQKKSPHGSSSCTTGEWCSGQGKTGKDNLCSLTPPATRDWDGGFALTC